jgi:tripartite-type tricarboxylate transporter receptor subunit TctC
MRIPRRRLLQLAASCGAVAVMPQLGWTQAYPSRTITLVVFTPPGGAPDIVGRLIGHSLSQRLGQPIVVENRPGAGGNLALQSVVRAPADGYTLLLVATPHAVNVTLYEKSNVNITRDIVPAGAINNDSFVMLVNPSLPVRTVSEFVAYTRANPGKINMSSSGTGNLSHLAGELFRMTTGADMTPVPYRGTPAALTALMTGDAHVMFDGLPSALPHIKDGKMRALGVTTEKRASTLPNVPPIAETVPGYAVTGWLGIGAPKSTPPEIIERLNKEINATLADKEFADRLAAIGSDPRPGSPTNFGKFIAEEAEKWGKVVKFAGLKAD